MARKHGNKNNSRSKPRPFNRKDDTMKRWNKAEDIPLDEEDQFHASRDRILLDGEGAHSDDEGDEDEVFALKGMPDESDEEDEEGGDNDTDSLPKPTKASKTKGKGKQKESAASASEEGSGSEDEEEGWGHKKSAYYASNDAELDSDDEEANEMEEQEARRLQAKARDSMTDEDFGLDDIPEAGSTEQDGDFDEPVPSIQVQSLPQDKLGLLRHLQKTAPEALALAGDWDSAAQTLIKTQQQIVELQGDRQMDMINSGMLHLYYQALLQYAATLAFYLYLRASDRYIQHPESLRSHPIMSRLLTLKQSIATLEDLGVGESDDEDDSDLGSDDEGDEALFSQLRGIPVDELRALLADMQGVTSVDEKNDMGKQASAKNAKRATGLQDEPPKKKRKTDAETKTPVAIFDLEEPEFPAKKKSTAKASTNSDADAFGEYTTLQVADAQDKAARKRSLRFHTSKIESASSRRERARANTGGDDDIPWRDRKREQEAAQRKAAQKSRDTAGDDLDDDEPEPRTDATKKKRTREEAEDGSDDDNDADGGGANGYYDLVQRKSKDKKEKKKADYEAAQAAAKAGVHFDESAEGPRSVSRAILKNRGLTPSRSKSVRNPRVKKRQRYEKAKKKVSSQKATFKGGLASTGGKYEGEKSGISKVIKGVKLT